MVDAILTAIVVVVIVVIVIGVVGLLIIQALRRRREKLVKELEGSKASVDERAFNRILLGRSAADHLERSGIDVAGPRRLLDQASTAYDSGRHDDALALASSAHEALLNRTAAPMPAPGTLRAEDPLSAPPPADSSPAPAFERVVTAPAADTATNRPADSAPGRLPKNKAESKFQLKLLDGEMAAGGPPGTTPATMAGVRGIAADAQRAFDREEFTDALRLALKARRTLGAHLETLPPPGPPIEGPPGASDAAATPSAADRCQNCGQPLRAGDQFCRGCGTSVRSTRCARCGGELTVSDQFCGRCGAPRAP